MMYDMAEFQGELVKYDGRIRQSGREIFRDTFQVVLWTFRGLPCDHCHTFMAIIKMSYLRRRNVIYLTPKPNCFKNIYLNNKAIQLLAFPISI